MVLRSYPLADILKRENNNFDLVRIIAASLVIFSHAYKLSPQKGKEDFITYFFVFESAGSLAVKIFFFISGLVVTNSLLSKKNGLGFFIARTLRIMPALALVLFVTTFIMGPLVSSVAPDNYFTSRETFVYFVKNLLMITVYALPGVFTHNPWPIAVNGSLWTLSYEVGAYMLLLAFFYCGIFRYASLASVVCLAIIVDSAAQKPFAQIIIDGNPDIYFLPASFALGALLAVNRERISINHVSYLFPAIITWITWGTHISHTMFILSICFAVLYFAASKTAKRLRIKSDISYGTYLWGFPVQQCVALYFPHHVYLNMCLTLIISLAIAYLSWILVEKRCIDIGSKLIKYLHPQGQKHRPGSYFF